MQNPKNELLHGLKQSSPGQGIAILIVPWNHKRETFSPAPLCFLLTTFPSSDQLSIAVQQQLHRGMAKGQLHYKPREK